MFGFEGMIPKKQLYCFFLFYSYEFTEYLNDFLLFVKKICDIMCNIINNTLDERGVRNGYKNSIRKRNK